MQRTIRDGGRDWLNPTLFSFTDAAKRKIAETRAAFPDKTPVFYWAKSIKVHRNGGGTDRLGDGLIVGLAAPDELPEGAFIVLLDGSKIGIEITSDATNSATPVIDTGPDGRRFLLR